MSAMKQRSTKREAGVPAMGVAARADDETDEIVVGVLFERNVEFGLRFGLFAHEIGAAGQRRVEPDHFVHEFVALAGQAVANALFARVLTHAAIVVNRLRRRRTLCRAGKTSCK